MEIFILKPLVSCRKIKYVLRDVKWCFNALWGLKGLNRAYIFETNDIVRFIDIYIYSKNMTHQDNNPMKLNKVKRN